MAKSKSSTVRSLTRYQAISDEVIGELRAAYRRGADPSRVVPWLSLENKRLVLAETRYADRLRADARAGVGDGVMPLTDFGCAVVAEDLLTGNPQDARLSPEAQELFESIGSSPLASPLLAYETLYRDMAEPWLLDADERAMHWLLRALAHNLSFHEGDDVAFIAVDVASALLQLGDLDRGLAVLTEVAGLPEATLWVCRFMATGFGVLGLVDLGLQGARCGLRLLTERGDPQDLRDEFLMAQFDLLSSPTKGREAESDPSTVRALERALEASDGSDRATAHDLILDDVLPELKRVPAKRAMRFADLPKPVQAQLSPGDA